MGDLPYSTAGRGPLGGRTNQPQVDHGTTNRQRSKPGLQCEDDLLLSISAYAMLQSARAMMDEQAQEIFDLWFSGEADDEVTFDSEEWGNYMRAEKHLQQQIEARLTKHAEQLRDQSKGSTHTVEGEIDLTFHAEVGGKYGGYWSGYNLLHGSNKEVGDFELSGRFKAVRSHAPGGAYTVTYEKLEYVFNDIADVNTRYSSDVGFARMAANMASCLGSLPPKDYTLHVEWDAAAPIKIEVK